MTAKDKAILVHTEGFRHAGETLRNPNAGLTWS
jgi:hypothetical protein